MSCRGVVRPPKRGSRSEQGLPSSPIDQHVAAVDLDVFDVRVAQRGEAEHPIHTHTHLLSLRGRKEGESGDGCSCE